MADLEKAITIAVQAHTGQTDKVGQPYILHVLTVMFSLDTTEEKIVGVLHDVIEDTTTTLDDLRAAGFSENVLSALNALTHPKHEPYETYIQRVSENPLATRVKLADLEHNMDARRFATLDPDFPERIKKYHKAWRFLRYKTL